jgi:hypothetical protein
LPSLAFEGLARSSFNSKGLCSITASQSWHIQKSHDVSDFAEVDIEVPAGIPSGYKQLCLFTRIRVFEEEKLDYWQCSLTQPQIIMNLEQSKNMIKRIG